MFPHLNPHFEFDTHFDKIPKNQCFHPFSHHQKSPVSHPKIPSNPYKLRLQSNSTENPIFNNKKHFTNHIKSNLKISSNTSKINTFTLQHKSKFQSPIEVQNLSHHKSYNESNQNSHLSPIQKENIKMYQSTTAYK